MSFTVNIEYKPEFEKKLKPDKALKAMEKSVNEVLLDLDATLRKKVPKKTGFLRDSHSYDTKTAGQKVTGLTKNSAPYWIYVEFGTSKMDARHWITDSISEVQPRAKLGEKFKHFYEKV